MKISRATEEEIYKLNSFLQEIESLGKAMENNYSEEIDYSEYEIISKMIMKDKENGYFAEHLLCNICQHLSGLNYPKIIFNLITLLDNCADKECDVLEFNKKIRRAMELFDNS